MSVTAERGAGGLTVTWSRPDRLNAWTRETIAAIADAIEGVAGDETVRWVVVRGAGGEFSSGDDLHEAARADREQWAATIAAFQRLTRVTLAAPVPVLAAIDGVCIGGALEFAAGCDLRVATTRARFGTPEVGIGFVATNAGTLLLPEALGETAARELLLTGRVMDAAWALTHGFVTELVEPAELDARVRERTAAIEAASYAAVAATKALLNARYGGQVEAALEREAAECVRLFGLPDARAALAAFTSARRA